MWRFQQNFRLAVEHELEQALSDIGFVVKVHILLVGFAITDDVNHQLCIEPEDGPLTTINIPDILALAEDIYQTDPASELIHSHPEVHQLRHQRLRLQARAEALMRRIEESSVFPSTKFFVSISAPICGYRVHTCVGIPIQDLDTLAALEDDHIDLIYVGQSLQHAVINECLHRADQALYLPDPGADLRVIGPTDDIVRAAADSLVKGMVYRTGGVASDLFRAVNNFTALSYERANDTKGCLIISDADKVAEQAHIQFQKPISIYNARNMRKLLELSDDTTVILSDYRRAYGLGAYNAIPDSIEIRVRGHADWEALFNGIALIRVRNGHAKLPPKPPITRERLADLAERIVGSIELDRIWSVIDKAQISGHGMTLVISHDPSGETSRLGDQAMPTVPRCLNPADIVRLGHVDGAVILGPDGHCYAFGVILDGEAERGRGDPARGSRFNSAVRYQRTKAPNSLIVVISDDGMVDLIPPLKPRVHRYRVEQAVADFCAICNTDPVDGEKFAQASDMVEELAFYLNQDQCNRFNECYKKEMDNRLESGNIAIIPTPLRPHPDMDDSYFY